MNTVCRTELKARRAIRKWLAANRITANSKTKRILVNELIKYWGNS